MCFSKYLLNCFVFSLSFWVAVAVEVGPVWAGPGDLSWAEASSFRRLDGPGSAKDEIASEPTSAADVRGGQGHGWAVAEVAASTMSAADPPGGAID